MNLDLEVELPPPEWIVHFVEDIPTAVAVFDGELRYVAANAAWLDIFCLGAAPVAGRRHDEIAPQGGPQLTLLQRRALAGEAVTGGAFFDAAAGEGRHCALSVRPRRSRHGTVLGVIAALHESAAASERSAPEAGSDRLTGIAGRDHFLTRLRAALPPGGAASQGASVQGAAVQGAPVFLLDIDDFKGVNELYGTRVGDRVLKTVATRLLTGVRSQVVPAEQSDGRAGMSDTDLVARLGADEFAVLLGSALPSRGDADAFARRLLQLVETPVVVGEQRIRLTANVGYIVPRPTHRSADDVMRDLNIALREAKAQGPNNARAWEPALAGTAGRRLVMLDQLRRALEEGEFVLHYQPILNLADDRVVGAEALLRWNHPSDGLMPPAEFLPLLEESGLIVPVGAWVIREVVRQMQVWQMLYGRDMLEWVAVNVSARQFNDPSLLLATLGEINHSGFPLDRLKIEITESAVMRNPEATRGVLGQLQKLGISIALDDFGTGYSALGALRHYTVDTIKIDRDFTARLDTEHGRELMLALLKISRLHGAVVVAEGVETALQRDVLRSFGCDFAQGYLFARPMDGSFFGAYALTHLVEDAAVG
ncbi:MAG TPA: EAL domain-containing protein [Stellaceae bacterium]|nr:EAL domain-containing protein [Stellaceae bacterium]